MQEQIIVYGNELYHFGSKGMKWGKRRYQNEDGSLTEEGRIHYGYGPARAKYESLKGQTKVAYKKADKAGYDAQRGKNVRLKNIFTKEGRRKNVFANADNAKEYANSLNKWANLRKKEYDAKQSYKKSGEYKQQVKKYLKIGAAIAGTALAAYGGYKLYQNREQLEDFINAGKQKLSMIKNPKISNPDALINYKTGLSSVSRNVNHGLWNTRITDIYDRPIKDTNIMLGNNFKPNGAHKLATVKSTFGNEYPKIERALNKAINNRDIKQIERVLVNDIKIPKGKVSSILAKVSNSIANSTSNFVERKSIGELSKSEAKEEILDNIFGILEDLNPNYSYYNS